MSNTDDQVDHPFGRFRVTTERMRDGRAIQYYEWPDDSPVDPGPGDAAAPGTREHGEDEVARE